MSFLVSFPLSSGWLQLVTRSLSKFFERVDELDTDKRRSTIDLENDSAFNPLNPQNSDINLLVRTTNGTHLQFRVAFYIRQRQRD